MPKALEPADRVARKIVAAGYKALAQKNHPDHGGTSDAMAAINVAKEWIDALIDRNAFSASSAQSRPRPKPEPQPDNNSDSNFDWFARHFAGGRKKQEDPFNFRSGSYTWAPGEDTDQEKRDRDRAKEANENRKSADEEFAGFGQWEDAERLHRQEQQAEQARRQQEVHVEGDWVVVENVECVNGVTHAICCKYFDRKVIWVSKNAIHKDSEVKRPGDRGRLKVRIELARKAGILRAAGINA